MILDENKLKINDFVNLTVLVMTGGIGSGTFCTFLKALLIDEFIIGNNCLDNIFIRLTFWIIHHAIFSF